MNLSRFNISVFTFENSFCKSLTSFSQFPLDNLLANALFLRIGTVAHNLFLLVPTLFL